MFLKPENLEQVKIQDTITGNTLERVEGRPEFEHLKFL